MASEVTIRKLTTGFTVSALGGGSNNGVFAEATRPAMIQRVLRCLGIEPADVYLDANSATVDNAATLVTRDPEQDDDEGQPAEPPRVIYGHTPPFAGREHAP